ncbi:MAG: hypothetical protein LKJ76_06600 [Lachnospiraceae bacterium]|jgi:steroid 5-alpha reductase family enzyme|nr:hypothetical protein [Lachnospiraceae bacterium]
MPETKFQKVIFGLLMSYSMAIGMEVYNTAIKMNFQSVAGGFSGMDYSVFTGALSEATYMGLIVFLVSSLFGNRLGARIGAKHADPSRDNPYYCRLMRQAGTVAVMCPSMSFAATILFSVIKGGAALSAVPVIWVGTLMKNFPMAVLWNMFAAAPFTHFLFSALFRKEQKQE